MISFGVEVVGCPIVREEDGLAKSSRNTYLSAGERSAARVLYRSITAAQEMIAASGVEVPADEVLSLMRRVVSEEPAARIDYIEAVDGVSLMPVECVKKGTLIALAVYIGKTRLIDNFTV